MDHQRHYTRTAPAHKDTGRIRKRTCPQNARRIFTESSFIRVFCPSVYTHEINVYISYEIREGARDLSLPDCASVLPQLTLPQLEFPERPFCYFGKTRSSRHNKEPNSARKLLDGKNLDDDKKHTRFYLRTERLYEARGERERNTVGV